MANKPGLILWGNYNNEVVKKTPTLIDERSAF